MKSTGINFYIFLSHSYSNVIHVLTILSILPLLLIFLTSSSLSSLSPGLSLSLCPPLLRKPCSCLTIAHSTWSSPWLICWCLERSFQHLPPLTSISPLFTSPAIVHYLHLSSPLLSCTHPSLYFFFSPNTQSPSFSLAIVFCTFSFPSIVSSLPSCLPVVVSTFLSCQSLY